MTRNVKRRFLPFTFGVALAGVVVVHASVKTESLERSRNFFGRITVDQSVDFAGEGASRRVVRQLRHGSTLHGEQITGDAVEPGAGHTYFGTKSGVAYALRHHPAASVRPLRVGIIGLGTGTLAVHARERDEYTFYEIDPAIVGIAEAHFTYMADARRRGAITNVLIGDGRIRLERGLEQGAPRRFDVLVLDAFSSDAVPVHLLTREAGRAYWQHLADDGLLLVHVSNRHLDLLPVGRGLAHDAGKQLRLTTVSSEEAKPNNASAWVTLTDNEEFLGQEAVRELQASRSSDKGRSLLWTDDFNSLWHVIR